MLTDYNGPSNHKDIFRHLAREPIVAAFEVKEREGTHVYLILGSGDAIAFGGGIGGGCGPTYWRVQRAEVNRIVAARREEIKRQMMELGSLGDVPIDEILVVTAPVDPLSVARHG